MERTFYQRKMGADPKEPLDSIKKRYYISQVGGNGSMTELQKSWLRKIISDNGGTPSGNYISSLLIQALGALGYPVTKYEGSNWQTLYQNY